MNPLIAPIPILVAIGFASGFTFNFTPNPYAELSIFLATIGIGLAVAIFIIQQDQNKKISELTKEQHELVSDINKRTEQQDMYRKNRIKLILPDVLSKVREIKSTLEKIQEILKQKDGIDKIAFLYDQKKNEVQKVIQDIKVINRQITKVK